MTLCADIRLICGFNLFSINWNGNFFLTFTAIFITFEIFELFLYFDDHGQYGIAY